MIAHLKIKKLRELKNLSQEWVGEQLGVGQPDYSKIENGIVKLTPDKIEKLAKIFGVEINELYSDGNNTFNITNNDNGKVFGVVNDYHDSAEYLKELLKQKDQTIDLLKEEIGILKKTIEVLENK